MTQTVRFISSIHDIGSETWNTLLDTDNPFLRFEFLSALEDTYCIDSPKNTPFMKDSQNYKSIDSGWIPHYAILEELPPENQSSNQEPNILAIAPVFKKYHSYGEYVFDWSWAEAYERHGLNYYPKLVWAIPFTPSSGPRIISQGTLEQINDYYQKIAQGLTEYCQLNQLSGWHCLFPDAPANVSLNTPPPLGSSKTTTMQRLSCQFHWYNNKHSLVNINNDSSNYFQDFEEYLETFSSRKRKNVKKERTKLLTEGFTFQQKESDEITPEDILSFYNCYQQTYAKRNSQGYLSLEFFQRIHQEMPEALLLVQAKLPVRTTPSDNDKIHAQDPYQKNDTLEVVANALYFKDENNLYGRYWGCFEEFYNLHFECCYYQGIEYCIKKRLGHFDPGTQGEHKISRGFRPITCFSQHWIAHPQFAEAIQDFIHSEKQNIQLYAEAAGQRLPFNQSYLNTSKNDNK